MPGIFGLKKTLTEKGRDIIPLPEWPYLDVLASKHLPSILQFWQGRLRAGLLLLWTIDLVGAPQVFREPQEQTGGLISSVRW